MSLPRESAASAAAWVAAVAAPAVATTACLALDASMSLAGLAMVYVVAVAAAAALPRGPAVASALLSVASLNYFFVPPRGSLDVGNAEHGWILLAMLGLSLALGAVLASLRRQRSRAELGQARASDLHRLAEALAGIREPREMAGEAAALLARATGRPAAVFLRGDDRAEPAPQACDGGAAAGVEGDAAPTARGDSDAASAASGHDGESGGSRSSDDAPDGLVRLGSEGAFDARAAAWAMANGRPIGAGSADWPDLPLWCAPFAGAGSRGAVQLLLQPGARVDAEHATHWLALARQAGLAIERANAARSAEQAGRSASAEAARNTLLASLAHDLRTPLAGIVGTASTLRTQAGGLGEGQKAALLDNLEQEARDLSLMADNILQIARLSQPQAQLALQWESIEDVLGAAVARMRRRWPGASIQLRVPHGLPPVRAEAGLLSQALANLVDNAARHGGTRAQVVVQAGRSRTGVFVAVRDHGPGLPPGEPAALFDRWRTGPAGRGGGSGLGLAICQLAALAHGGAIRAARCEPGAEFRIDLPAQPAPAENP